MNCEVIIICAVAADGGIGRNGDLAFHISADLKRFKALTTGHTVVMGRKTFESLPKGALPNRRNIVVTRNPDLHFPGAETAGSIQEAIAMAEAAGETELFIIGGGQIYAAAFPLADRLEITEINAAAPDADTFFPTIDPALWTLCPQPSPWLTDDRSGTPYRFATYRPLPS